VHPPIPQVKITDSQFQAQFNRYASNPPPPVGNNFSFVPPSSKYNYSVPSAPTSTYVSQSTTNQFSSDFALRNLTPPVQTGDNSSDFLRKID